MLVTRRLFSLRKSQVEIDCLYGCCEDCCDEKTGFHRLGFSLDCFSVPAISGGSAGRGLVWMGKLMVVPKPKLLLPPPMPTAILFGMPTLQAVKQQAINKINGYGFMFSLYRLNIYV